MEMEITEAIEGLRDGERKRTERSSNLALPTLVFMQKQKTKRRSGIETTVDRITNLYTMLVVDGLDFFVINGWLFVRVTQAD